MASISPDRLRNIVLLSHSGAGKTILAESMLHACKVTSRLGTIEDGTTSSDFEPEEVRRQSSIQAAILPCPWRQHKINVIDTPGYADFRGEVLSGVSVADAALIVVSAPSGVEVGTRQMWKLAEERGLPRVVFVSKMDRENADFGRAMEAITDAFGRHCVALDMPVGAEQDLSGTVSLMASGDDVPPSVQAEFEAARDRLIEAVAETDDDLATKYLEGEEIGRDELSAGLRKAVSDGTVVPVLAGASATGVGIEALMDALVDFMPAPGDVGPAMAEEGEVAPDPSGPMAAFVFKTAADPFVGKLSYFRVCRGTFKSDSQAWNASRGEAERIGQLYEVRGKAQEGVPELVAGDIGAVSKLTSVLTGNTLCVKDSPAILPPLEFPNPVYQRSVYPSSKADVDKMTSSLARISEEDPSLSVTREPNTLEVLLGGLGDSHVDLAVEKMKRKFGVEVELREPKVPYKETISAVTKVEYRHKKQTGGHGQFGHVWLELEPMPRAAGFEFASAIVGGAVPREYIPSVEKGVVKSLTDGVVAGFPIVDLKATLVDGSFHSVDSSGMSFEIAGSHALIKGIQQAQPVLLEPIMRAEIAVPDEFTGEIIGDLNSRRGRILGMVPSDGTTTVEAEVPQAEMLQYATELRSQTQGLGAFTIEFDHYEEVPRHLLERLVDSMKEREEARV